MNQTTGDELWLTICTQIAKLLEEVRPLWYEVCVDHFEQFKKGNPESTIRITKPFLGGEADLAIKAYQLFAVTEFLAEGHYISRTDGERFADVLWAAVCGSTLDDTMRYFRRYEEVGRDVTTRAIRFLSDVTKHMTDKQNPVYPTILAIQLPLLDGFTRISVARAFGDEARALQIQKSLEDF